MKPRENVWNTYIHKLHSKFMQIVNIVLRKEIELWIYYSQKLKNRKRVSIHWIHYLSKNKEEGNDLHIQPNNQNHGIEDQQRNKKK